MTLIGQQATVVGAGIAGLAVARALALRGAAVTVLEQAPEIAEIGAGLQISPNGMRVIDALGLGPALRAVALRAEAVELCDARGARVLRLPVGRAEPGYFFVHRADLIALLAAEARAAGVAVRLGERVDGIGIADGVPSLADGGGWRQVPLLIGADGLHSRVRQALNGRAVPFFTRQVAWRATVPGGASAPAVARVFMGPGRHLVTYPLRGGRQINIVAVEERGAWAEEGWQHEDDPANLRVAFAGFGAAVRDLLARVERVHLWGLFRHPVARRWHDGGRVAVLGDAAHPTLPFLAQGANLALEDAWALAAALARHESAAAGLAAYQAARAPRVTRAIAAATRNARTYHLSAPLWRGTVHAALRLAGAVAPGAVLGRLDWLYGHDVTQDG